MAAVVVWVGCVVPVVPVVGLVQERVGRLVEMIGNALAAVAVAQVIVVTALVRQLLIAAVVVAAVVAVAVVVVIVVVEVVAVDEDILFVGVIVADCVFAESLVRVATQIVQRLSKVKMCVAVVAFAAAVAVVVSVALTSVASEVWFVAAVV
jgi:hypothetical protein